MSKRKILSLILSAAIIFSFVFLPPSSALQQAKALAEESSPSAPITMAAFGNRVKMPGMTDQKYGYGDTWDSTWRANDEVYVQLNDGTGFSNYETHSKLLRIDGTPEDPSTLGGENINPGTLGSFFGTHYTNGIYEVDGVLYCIYTSSNQQTGNWFTYRVSLYKSEDGGANWINSKGQVNTLLPDSDQASMWPDRYFCNWHFVKYGQDGDNPGNIDNGQTYVYMIAAHNGGGYLCRVSKLDLPLLDVGLYEYYTGGDGMDDMNWSSNPALAYLIPDAIATVGCVYNFELGRYLALPGYSDCFANPPIDSAFFVYEAPYPWGPWTQIHTEYVTNKDDANLAWTMLMQKFTSADGKKMWTTVCGQPGGSLNPYTGQSEYTLQFKPLYLTTEPVSTYEAEAGALTGGTIVDSSRGDFTGSGYVKGFDSVGDGCEFDVTVAEAGAYILKFRYSALYTGTPYMDYSQLSCYVNGALFEHMRLSKTYGDWSEYTVFAWLDEGSNTVSIQFDAGDNNIGQVELDNLRLALYSTEPGSLPYCYPVPPSEVFNGDFELGTYAGWYSAGTAFGVVPNCNNWGLANVQGSYWVDSYARGGQSATGTIKSGSFTCGDTLSFLKAGWDGGGSTPDYYCMFYLKRVSDNSILYSAPAPQSYTFVPQVWDTSAHKGEAVYFEAVDSNSNSWCAWIAFDDVRVDSNNDPGDEIWTDVFLSDPSVSWGGTWSGDGISTLWGNDTSTPAYIECEFNGTGIRWLGDHGPNHGIVDVYIDEVFVESVDCYSAPKPVEVKFEITGLTSGTHTLRIELSGGKNIAASDYYQHTEKFQVANESVQEVWTNVPLNNPNVNWGGTWSGDGITTLWGNDTSTPAYIECTFYGTGVRWIGGYGTNHGIVNVYLNGALIDSVDCYSSSNPGVKYEITGLAIGTYTIRFKLNGGKNIAASDYFQHTEKFQVLS